jgi:acyl carrier protein
LKIRGLRIEPGEIECQLADCEGVAEAVVVPRPNAAGDTQLVAYIVPSPGATLEIADLHARLVRVLPEFMVPTAWKVVDALPLTVNGKLDRNALPPADGGPDMDERVPPRTRLEEQVAALWAELLGRERSSVGVETNFFTLGGNSLLLIQMVRQVKSTFGVELSVSGTFARATVREVARAIEIHALKQRTSRDLAALSAAQVEQMEF